MKLRALLLGLVLSAGLATSLRAQETPPQSTVIKAKFTEMKSSDTETEFLLTGNVRVEATALLLTCDRLEIVALRSAKRLKELKGSTLADPDKFKSLIAIGNVRIVQNDRIATCGRAEILPQEDRITLTEKPFIQDGQNEYTGSKITMYRGEEKVEIEDSHFVGPPVKDLSKQATKSAGAPPATTTPPGAPQISLPTPEKKP